MEALQALGGEPGGGPGVGFRIVASDEVQVAVRADEGVGVLRWVAGGLGGLGAAVGFQLVVAPAAATGFVGPVSWVDRGSGGGELVGPA